MFLIGYLSMKILLIKKKHARDGYQVATKSTRTNHISSRLKHFEASLTHSLTQFICLFIQPPASPVEGFELDNGLLLSKKDKYYGLTLPFQTPLTMGDSPSIVIQYEIKFEEVLACGGAYVKLLRDITDFGDVNKDTPYSILFGPDKVTHSLTHSLTCPDKVTHSLTYLLTYSYLLVWIR